MTAETAAHRRDMDAALAAIKDEGERLDELLAEMRAEVDKTEGIKPW